MRARGYGGGETSGMSYVNNGTDFVFGQSNMMMMMGGDCLDNTEAETQRAKIESLEERLHQMELQLAGHPAAQAVFEMKLSEAKEKNEEQDRKIAEIEKQRVEDKKRIDDLVNVVAAMKLNNGAAGGSLFAPTINPSTERALELVKKSMTKESKPPLKEALISNGKKYMLSILNAYHPRINDQRDAINLCFNVLEKMTVPEQ